MRKYEEIKENVRGNGKRVRKGRKINNQRKKGGKVKKMCNYCHYYY